MSALCPPGQDDSTLHNDTIGIDKGAQPQSERLESKRSACPIVEDSVALAHSEFNL